MPGFIGVPELIVLAIVLLLIFGPKRLPEIGKSMGKGMREFKESVSGITGDEPAKPAAELPKARSTPDPTAERQHEIRAIEAPSGAFVVSTPAVARDGAAA